MLISAFVAPLTIQAEVLLTGDLCDQDIGGLDVSVHETLGMGRVQRLCHLRDELHGARRIQRAVVGQEPGKIGALHVAHGQVQLAFCLTCPVDRHDVRMVERGGQLRLPQEALPEAAVLRELRRDHFQRHLARELFFLGPVDGAHAAAADQRLDPVAGDGAAQQRVGAIRGGHVQKCP